MFNLSGDFQSQSMSVPKTHIPFGEKLKQCRSDLYRTPFPYTAGIKRHSKQDRLII